MADSTPALFMEDVQACGYNGRGFAGDVDVFGGH